MVCNTRPLALAALLAMAFPLAALAEIGAPPARIAEYKSGVTDAPTSTVTLRDFVLQRFAAVDVAIDSLRREFLTSTAVSKEAVATAIAALNIRFESVNEFRQTLTDQALTFANKDAVDARFFSLEEKIDVATRRLDAIASAAAGSNNLWIILLGVFGAISLIASFVIGVRNAARSPVK